MPKYTVADLEYVVRCLNNPEQPIDQVVGTGSDLGRIRSLFAVSDYGPPEVSFKNVIRILTQHGLEEREALAYVDAYARCRGVNLLRAAGALLSRANRHFYHHDLPCWYMPQPLTPEVRAVWQEIRAAAQRCGVILRADLTDEEIENGVARLVDHWRPAGGSSGVN